MKFTINRNELYTGLAIAGRAVSKTGIIPILTSYQIEIKKNTLIIAGSDQENLITYATSVKGDDLNIAIPATVLFNLIKELPEQPLSFDIDNKVCTIKSASGKYKIPVESGVDFPKIKHDAEQVFTLNSETLIDNLQRTVFAVAQNHALNALNQLLLKVDKERTTLVASNGMIMSVRYMDIPGNETELLFSPQSLSMVTSLPYNETCTLSLSKTSARFVMNDNTVFTCVLNGEKYPDFERIIPTGNDKVLSVETSELSGSLKRLQIFASEANNDFIISMNGKTSITSENLKSEKADEDINANYNGEPLDVKMKCGQMLALLNKVTSNTIEISFKGEKTGVLIKEPETDNLMMIMPIV